MFEIATAFVLLAALAALVSLWSPLIRRLTQLAARYILPMPFGLPEQAGSSEHGTKPSVRHSL